MLAGKVYVRDDNSSASILATDAIGFLGHSLILAHQVIDQVSLSWSPDTGDNRFSTKYQSKVNYLSENWLSDTISAILKSTFSSYLFYVIIASFLTLRPCVTVTNKNAHSRQCVFTSNMKRSYISIPYATLIASNRLPPVLRNDCLRRYHYNYIEKLLSYFPHYLRYWFSI